MVKTKNDPKNVKIYSHHYLIRLTKPHLANMVIELSVHDLIRQQDVDRQSAQISELQAQIAIQQSQIAALQKNSSNSSKPPSSDMPSAPDRKHNNSRKSSGKKPGGQLGHKGITLQPVDSPDDTIECVPTDCENCGVLLDGQTAPPQLLSVTQVKDIPPIEPTITEYHQFARTCACGHTTIGILPDGITPNDGGIQIGPNASSFLVYLNTAHHIPYDRLGIVSRDIFNFPLSVGTIANKLEKAAVAAVPVAKKILTFLHSSKWVGSDETGVRVAGKRIWQWIWQNAGASYYVVSLKRDYQTVKDHFGENFLGVLIHDCLGAQNKTKALAHQLCHAHLLRDLQFIIDAGLGDMAWAYKMQRLLLCSQRARDHSWAEGFASALRQTIQADYLRRLDNMIEVPVASKAAIKLRNRFRKHKDKILYFMSDPDIPPDNNGSERAVRPAKTKQKVSGGFRSNRGADRHALLLSVIETAKKQDLNVLETIKKLLSGEDVVLFRG
jgi:transposase